MGSNYFGDSIYMAGHMNMNETAEFLSSSVKVKKNGSNKPKQLQKGLGVAQLKKIRLDSQLGCAYLPSHYGPNILSESHMKVDMPHSSSVASYNGFNGHMTGLPDLNCADATYGDSQSSNISRLHQGNSGFGSTQHYSVESSMSNRSLFDQGSLTNNNKRKLMDLVDSSADNSESQDLDLELRL